MSKDRCKWCALVFVCERRTFYEVINRCDAFRLDPDIKVRLGFYRREKETKTKEARNG